MVMPPLCMPRRTVSPSSAERVSSESRAWRSSLAKAYSCTAGSSPSVCPQTMSVLLARERARMRCSEFASASILLANRSTAIPSCSGPPAAAALPQPSALTHSTEPDVIWASAAMASCASSESADPPMLKLEVGESCCVPAARLSPDPSYESARLPGLFCAASALSSCPIGGTPAWTVIERRRAAMGVMDIGIVIGIIGVIGVIGVPAAPPALAPSLSSASRLRCEAPIPSEGVRTVIELGVTDMDMVMGDDITRDSSAISRPGRPSDSVRVVTLILRSKLRGSGLSEAGSSLLSSMTLAGVTIVNVVPFPTSESHVIFPFCADTSCRASVSPSPVPPCLRAMPSSPWLNAPQIRSFWPSGMPGPVSSMT
mmetsp:Transcript_46543/g.110240  ORF Transcript_46543/g.110240 Transcript_46543/m.110240 type:complete len:370 (+) Transcript_46543:208-1317(+)